MSRDYQRQKNNKYILPRAVYNQVLWRIRDYHRLKEHAKDILDASPLPADGLPKGNGKVDVVASKAEKREKYNNEIKAIDSAISVVPVEYRKGVWNNILYGQSFPMDADRSTYVRHKSKFVYAVAEKLFLI